MKELPLSIAAIFASLHGHFERQRLHPTQLSLVKILLEAMNDNPQSF
jgi:hypothetical protein